MLQNDTLKPANNSSSSFFTCDCGKVYKHSSGLSRHKNANKCEFAPTENLLSTTHLERLTNLVIEVVQQNKDLIVQNRELTEKLVTSASASASSSYAPPVSATLSDCFVNQSFNRTFNLNIFLNEQCKDAMNIMDFVDSLQLQLSDLENVGEHGFVEGISNIIVKNLKAMDVHKRPVHCSDFKREVMYVKDDDRWEKENSEKQKLRKAIKHIAHKNSKLIPEFRAKYPDCGKSSSVKSDQYNKLIVEAMGGNIGREKEDEKENKIIKKIAKVVLIDKLG